MLGEVSALTTRVHAPGAHHIGPLAPAGCQLHPGHRVHLHDVRWRAAGVPGARNALNRSVRRYPQLDTVTWDTFREDPGLHPGRHAERAPIERDRSELRN